MLDFTRAHYLDMTHPSSTLAPWDSLTTGRPAVLKEVPSTPRLRRSLALLTGCDDALLHRSTLHALSDCVGVLAGPGDTVLVEEGTYAVGLAAASQAASRGVVVRKFRHADPEDLAARLRRCRGRPLVLLDGYCTRCATAAPLSEYVEATRRRDGLVVVDDTQAFGVLGADPKRHPPYGLGGGGTARWAGVGPASVVTVASAAKAFGAPFTAVTGERAVVRRLARDGGMRMHASPPSAADVAAGVRAMELNARDGDARRSRLAAVVTRFRSRLRRGGVPMPAGSFPIQDLPRLPRGQAEPLYRRITADGVRTVLRAPTEGRALCVTFLLTAAHTDAETDHAADVAARAWAEVVRRAS